MLTYDPLIVKVSFEIILSLQSVHCKYQTSYPPIHVSPITWYWIFVTMRTWKCRSSILPYHTWQYTLGEILLLVTVVFIVLNLVMALIRLPCLHHLVKCSIMLCIIIRKQIETVKPYDSSCFFDGATIQVSKVSRTTRRTRRKMI